MAGAPPDPLPFLDSAGRPLRWEQLPFAVTARTGKPQDGFTWGWRPSESDVRWFRSNCRSAQQAVGQPTSVVFSLVDVTDAHTAQIALEEAGGRFAALVERSSDVICVLDPDTVVTYASPAYERVYSEDLVVRVGHRLTDRIVAADRGALLRAVESVVHDPERIATVECRVPDAQGRPRHVEITITNRLFDPAVAGLVANSRDVTDRVEASQRLGYQAMHDDLTGLPNRAAMLTQLELGLARRAGGGDLTAVLFIDLDHFKRINDSLGHRAGDELLKEAALRLKRNAWPGDTVARLGGDEFVVVAGGLSSHQTALARAAHLQRALAEPLHLGEHTYTIDCSIGIAFADGSTGDALLQQADTALYAAKERGRGRIETYDQAMHLVAQERLELERLLRRALTDRRMTVAYQPIVALPSGRTVGAEALARLEDSGVTIPPTAFIPVAEQTGLIVPLGLEVLRQACTEQVQGARAHRTRRRMSVNVAARQLRQPELTEEVVRTLHDTGLPAHQLCLELTESALIEADSVTMSNVSALHARGVRLALDDFGTGMSSLAHLRQFPIDVVKIDRSFVAGLGQNADDTEVVRAVISLAKALRLDVVAEGVEHPGQAALLTELGCQQAQGYLFGRPETLAARATRR